MTEPTSKRIPRSDRTPRRTVVIFCGVALAALGTISLWSGQDLPRATWRDGAGDPMSAYSHVDPSAAFTLQLELPRPMHVYVASHDLVRGTLAMRPSATLRGDAAPNPLPAGRHDLPGVHLDRALQWPVGDGVGMNTVVLIASEEPLPELVAALARCRQLGNAAFPDRPLLGTYAPATGMESTPPRSRPAHPLLEACSALIAERADSDLLPVPDAPGVYASVLRLHTDLARGGDVEAARRELAEQIGPMLEGALPLPDGTAPIPAAPPGGERR